MVEALVPAVAPGATPDELGSFLAGLGLVGSVVDGSALGLDGVAVARVVGDDDVVLVVGADGEPDDLEGPVVRERLVARWPGASWGTEAAEAFELQWPVMGGRPARGVAVTPPADLMLPVVVKKGGLVLHEARLGDRVLVGLADGHDLAADALVPLLVNAKGRSVVLWRSGGHLGLEVLKRGTLAASHVWEPAWTPFGQPDGDELRDPGVHGDAAAIGALLGLEPASVVSLRAMMRRSWPDLVGLAELLGLPHEMVEVIEGRTSVADLPGGSVVAPGSWRDEIASAFQVSEHDPRWMQRYEAGARALRPWYVVSSLVAIVAGVVLVVRWASGGPAFFGVVGLVFALGTTIDLAVRAGRRRQGQG